MIYNVKVTKYFTGTQVKVYEKSVKSGVVKNVDEYGVMAKYKEVRNPFSGDNELMKEFRTTIAVDPDESLRVSRTRCINTLYNILRANSWEWFFTFTFNPDKVNRYDYEDVSTKMTEWLKRQRKKYKELKYVIVPEMHKDGAFHFHALMSCVPSEWLKDSGKYVIKNINGRFIRTNQKIYNCNKFRYGFTTVTAISDSARASSYVTKYITKELCTCTVNKKRYWASRNLDSPVIEYHYFTDTDSLICELKNESEYNKKIVNDYNTINVFEIQQ